MSNANARHIASVLGMGGWVEKRGSGGGAPGRRQEMLGGNVPQHGNCFDTLLANREFDSKTS